MNLSFFTKIFGRSVLLSSSFGKTFSCVRDACKYKDKVYQADIYRKNSTCTSCAINGFKFKQKFMFVYRTKKLLVRPTSIGSDISYFHKVTEETLIRQLLQELCYKSRLILVCSVIKIINMCLCEVKGYETSYPSNPSRFELVSGSCIESIYIGSVVAHWFPHLPLVLDV